MTRSFQPLCCALALGLALALAGVAQAQPEDPGPRVEMVEFRELRLADALRLFAQQTGLKLVASAEASDREVSLYLRDVSALAAVRTLCEANDLWFQFRPETGVYRISTAEEYRRDVQSFREAQVEVFTLLYPNAYDVANAIRNLFGSRVVLSLGIGQDELLQELQTRFLRFDLLNARSQGFGRSALGGQGVGGAGGLGGFGGGLGGLGGFGGIGGLGGIGRGGLGALRRRGGGGLGGGLGFQGSGFNVQNQPRVDEADLQETQVEGLRGEDIQALEEGVGDRTQVVQRVLRQASIYVAVNGKNNQVMVRTGDLEALTQIRALVQRMDLPTPLVLLEVKVLSILLGDGFDSVFDYQFSDGSTSAAGFTTGNVLPPPSDTVSGDAARRAASLAPGGTGLLPERLLYQFVSSHFRARLQLLETEERVTAMATPLLLTANNEVSRLFAGEERPVNRSFEGGQTVFGAGGNFTNAGTTEIEFRPVGTTLLITPNINADRTVTLRILQETSSINLNGASVLVPSGDGFVRQPVDTVQSRAVSGTVVAKHGQTVAIGGLIEEELSDAQDQVPWVGRIPILGFFFRGQSTRRLRRELVITIRPYVLSTPVEADEFSRRVLEELSIHPNVPDARGTLDTYRREDVLQADGPPELQMFDLHVGGDDEDR